VRDAELFRRPPVVTGDEVIVSRWSRNWRARRRWIRLGYIASGVGLIVVMDALPATDGAVTVAALSVLTLGFMIAFLWAGSRMAMKPMEVYEDGIIGTELRFPIGRKRFLLWREVEGVELRSGEEGPPRLRVTFGSGRALESVPGEFQPIDRAVIEERIARSRAASPSAAPASSSKRR
jgi:hypothetical protein